MGLNAPMTEKMHMRSIALLFIGALVLATPAPASAENPPRSPQAPGAKSAPMPGRDPVIPRGPSTDDGPRPRPPPHYRLLAPPPDKPIAVAPLDEGEAPGEREEDEAEVGAEARVEPKGTRFQGIALPLVNFSTDMGFGYGAVGGAYFYHPDYEPFRYSVAVQAFWTTRQIQNHYLRLDAPDIVKGVRAELRAEYRRELFSPYFGVGNRAEEGFSGNLAEPAVNYERTFPGVWLRVRFKPLGPDHPFEPWVNAEFQHYDIGVLPGSALERERPTGMEGGKSGQLGVGLIWDNRDNETSSTRGGAEEIALRFASRWTFSDYTWGALTLVERRFWQLAGPRLVLAQRVVFEWAFGDVPFFELANFGGIQGGEGIGGMSSVRGVPRNRYQGEIKLFSNTELRWNPFDFSLLGQRITAGGIAFFDAGRVWERGQDNGPLWHWHPGAGLGLRFTAEAAVARIDAGFELETMRPGLYISLGQSF